MLCLVMNLFWPLYTHRSLLTVFFKLCLDVVKTRLQKQVIHPGKEPKYRGLLQSCIVIAKEEGILALWKGITPRLLRIMPGQAITFMTYEAVSSQMNRMGWFEMAET